MHTPDYVPTSIPPARILTRLDAGDHDHSFWRMPLRGWQHNEGPREWEALPQNGRAAAVLVAEPDNAHDRNAVAVYWLGLRIGYLPSEEAAAFRAYAEACRVLAPTTPLTAAIELEGSPRGRYVNLTVHVGTPWPRAFDDWRRLDIRHPDLRPWPSALAQVFANAAYAPQPGEHDYRPYLAHSGSALTLAPEALRRVLAQAEPSPTQLPWGWTWLGTYEGGGGGNFASGDDTGAPLLHSGQVAYLVHERQYDDEHRDRHWTDFVSVWTAGSVKVGYLMRADGERLLRDFLGPVGSQRHPLRAWVIDYRAQPGQLGDDAPNLFRFAVCVAVPAPQPPGFGPIQGRDDRLIHEWSARPLDLADVTALAPDGQPDFLDTPAWPLDRVSRSSLELDYEYGFLPQVLPPPLPARVMPPVAPRERETLDLPSDAGALPPGFYAIEEDAGEAASQSDYSGDWHHPDTFVKIEYSSSGKVIEPFIYYAPDAVPPETKAAVLAAIDERLSAKLAGLTRPLPTLDATLDDETLLRYYYRQPGLLARSLRENCPALPRDWVLDWSALPVGEDRGLWPVLGWVWVAGLTGADA